MIWTWKQDRTGNYLQRGMMHASSEETRANNFFHRIQEASVKLFDGYHTTLSGPVSLTCSEIMRNDLREEFHMSQVRNSVLVKLRESYGKVNKVRNPGARGSAV